MRLQKALYFAMPMLQASRANRIIDKKIDNKMADDQHEPVDVPVWVLRIRMKQEHERDRFIDSKTDRLGQRILGVLAFAGILFALVDEWSWFEIGAGLVFLIYIVRAWWLTVKANQTTKVYGFGTDFEHEGNRDQATLGRELYCQEMANTKKQNINVASVRCLRNALIVGTLGVLVSVLAHLVVSLR